MMLTLIDLLKTVLLFVFLSPLVLFVASASKFSSWSADWTLAVFKTVCYTQLVCTEFPKCSMQYAKKITALRAASLDPTVHLL